MSNVSPVLGKMQRSMVKIIRDNSHGGKRQPQQTFCMDVAVGSLNEMEQTIS